MTERLIEKLDRFGAEAGIKEMAPEIYRFAQLLNDDKLKQWDEWRANREWVGLTDEELAEFSDAKLGSYDLCLEVEAKLKEKNT
jgi:hypothetical protein